MIYNDKLQPINNINFPGANLIIFQLVHRLVNYNIKKNDYKPKYFFFFTIIKGIGNQKARSYDFNQKINIKYDTRELAKLSFVFKQLAVGNTYILPYDKFARNKHVNIWQPKPINQNIKFPKTINYNLVVSDKTHETPIKYTMVLNLHDMYALSIELDLLITKALTSEFREQTLAPIKMDNSIPTNNRVNDPVSINNQVNNFIPINTNNQPTNINTNNQPTNTNNQQFTTNYIKSDKRIQNDNFNTVQHIKNDFKQTLRKI